MIKEIKIDHTKPVWAWVWNMGSEKKHERLYLYTLRGYHYCVNSNYAQEFLNGKSYDTQTWVSIEFKKEKKLIPLDAKTCPRRPVLTHPNWAEGVERYPDIMVLGLIYNGVLTFWQDLKDGGFLINGLPASREVDE